MADLYTNPASPLRSLYNQPVDQQSPLLQLAKLLAGIPRTQQPGQVPQSGIPGTSAATQGTAAFPGALGALRNYAANQAGQALGDFAGPDALWQGAGNLDMLPTLGNLGASALSALSFL